MLAVAAARGSGSVMILRELQHPPSIDNKNMAGMGQPFSAYCATKVKEDYSNS
jgi:hypothetical protein